MRVFAVGTGRCGSTTFAEACSHITNFTSAHESGKGKLAGRLEYPDRHIEVDNRLSWFLASLHERYGNDVFYVHLTRDPSATTRSFVARWAEGIEREQQEWRIRPTLSPGALRRQLTRRRRRRTAWRLDPSVSPHATIAAAFGYAMNLRAEPIPVGQREEVCRLYVDTVNDNIAHFLSTTPRSCTVRLEHFAEDLVGFWDAIGAEGSLDRALGEGERVHNAGQPS
jgi:hypothetical protein